MFCRHARFVSNRQQVTSLHVWEADELAAFLKETRKTVGIGQERLSRQLGQSQNYIRKIETGERRIDVIEFYQVMRALNLDPAEVFGKFVNRIEQKKTPL